MLWEKEIQRALNVIETALAEYTHPYVSMSWGKDSIFLFYLIREIKPDIPLIYVNSGYALPDTYEIRDKLLDLWKPNYYEIRQEFDYIELCKTIGLPHDRTSLQQKKAVQMIKKNVLDQFAIDHSFDLCFWGIRCDESKGRSMLFRKNGFFVKSTEINKCHPIALIKQQQLWYFYEKFNIPVNQIYTKTQFLTKFQIRNTGWLSTDGAEKGKLAWLKYYYPEYYNKLKQNFNNVASNI